MRCDLHCHTDYSFDSTNSVEIVLKKAKEANIDVLAICDHNIVDGSLEAMKQNEIEIISGIEIDCFCKDTIIHLTAYGMDLTHPSFKGLIDGYTKELERVGTKRCDLLEEKYGCTLDRDKMKSYTHRGYPITNVEITQVLLEDCEHEGLLVYRQGEKAKNPIANYYWDHMAIGKWAYVEMQLPNYDDIIKWIHELKGVVICAHPKVTIGRNQEYIDCLIESGIDGFEVYCSYHNEDDATYYKSIVEKYDLCMTVGSDYHGSTKPNIEIGNTGYEGDCEEIVRKLKERIAFYKG